MELSDIALGCLGAIAIFIIAIGIMAWNFGEFIWGCISLEESNDE